MLFREPRGESVPDARSGMGTEKFIFGNGSQSSVERIQCMYMYTVPAELVRLAFSLNLTSSAPSPFLTPSADSLTPLSLVVLVVSPLAFSSSFVSFFKSSGFTVTAGNSVTSDPLEVGVSRSLPGEH